MKQYLSILFVVAALFELFVVQTNYPFRQISKPLIMITLLIYFVASMGVKISKHWLFIVALLFALAGDVFLLGEGHQSFTLGLGSFLIMQILYFIIFIKQKSIGIQKHYIKIIAILLLTAIFLYKILPYTGALQIPVIIYALSIAAMAIAGILRWRVSGYWWIVFGVSCFIISDGYLALNKFAGPRWNAGLIVMTTYIIAQFSIVEGYIMGAKATETYP